MTTDRIADGPQAFTVHRDVDVTGISGEGIVAEGVLFSDGWAITHWLDRPPMHEPKTEVWHHPGTEPFEKISGHNGSTRLVWDDSLEDRRRDLQAAEKTRREQLASALLRSGEASWERLIAVARDLQREDAELWRQLEAIRGRDGMAPDGEANRLRAEVARLLRGAVGHPFWDSEVSGKLERAVEGVWPLIVRLLVERDSARTVPDAPGRSRTSPESTARKAELFPPAPDRAQELAELHEAVAEALAEEHLRRSAERIMDSPEGHSRGMAEVLRPILIRLLAQRDGATRSRDQAELGVRAASDAAERWLGASDERARELGAELRLQLDKALTAAARARAAASPLRVIEVRDPCPHCPGAPLIPRAHLQEHLAENHHAATDAVQAGDRYPFEHGRATEPDFSDLVQCIHDAAPVLDRIVGKLPVSCPTHGLPKQAATHACCDQGVDCWLRENAAQALRALARAARGEKR